MFAPSAPTFRPVAAGLILFGLDRSYDYALRPCRHFSTLHSSCKAGYPDMKPAQTSHRSKARNFVEDDEGV